MTSFGNKLIFLTFIIIVNLSFSTKPTFSLENKIVIKIDNEIITTIDIANEIKYLKMLNKNLETLNEDKIYSIAKESLIKERIKKNELHNFVNEIKIDKNFLNKIIESTYSKIGLDSLDAFKEYIRSFELDLSYIENKISIEILWNELVVTKFSKNVKIDNEKLKQKILLINESKIKNYLLSEIMFEVYENEKLSTKFEKIKKIFNEN